MIKNLLFTLALISTVYSLSAQELYMPIEFQRAYENGTRKWDGSVSDTYFQNRAEYKIKADVDPTTRQLNATASITYFNFSPDALSSIGFHAYKDLYSEGMVIKKLALGGVNINLNDRSRIQKRGTFYSIKLAKDSFKPNQSVTLNVEWSITIPATVDRDGAYDATSMMVGYWYPEIAVYDDIWGWDDINFDGYAEFYHDASEFDVEITIPDNYIIWASDAPTNAEDIYPDKILDRLKEAKSKDKKVFIVTEKDLNKGLKMKSNTWKYFVSGYPDFSFAFSDHYVWEAYTYKDNAGTYFLNTAYPAENDAFKFVIDAEKQCIRSFHSAFPKYAFPFKHFVAFNGEKSGGMEFAGMCNDQMRINYSAEGISYSDYEANLLLTQHEMMHMYFPFLVYINEKRFAWMDEGMAEFSEDYYTGVNLESTRSRARFASDENAPLMVQTYTTPKTYVVNSYDIASQSYHALLNLLGQELFDKCMKGYIDRWQKKHPTPYDFFFTFNDISGRDLNWFWKAWYFDWGYPDVGIESFDGENLKLRNYGGRPIAIDVWITYEDASIESMKISPIVWKSQSTAQTPIYSEKKIVKLELKTLNGADAFLDNNIWEK